VNADGAGFEGGDFAHWCTRRGISCGSERHGGRKRRAFVQAHGRAALEVSATSSGNFDWLALIHQHAVG